MRKFTLEQYKQMSASFNKKPFSLKIKLLQENSDILVLACDYNWWGVKVRDKEIQEQLYELDEQFTITSEWGYNEMSDLIGLLGLEMTDI